MKTGRANAKDRRARNTTRRLPKTLDVPSRSRMIDALEVQQVLENSIPPSQTPRSGAKKPSAVVDVMTEDMEPSW